MLSTLIGGLIGLIFGGAAKAFEVREARKHESEAILSAILSEIEAIVRLVRHRRFVPLIAALRDTAAQQIAEGKGDEETDWMVLGIQRNYFATYEALIGKIGYLHPYYADRITRFYTLAKAATENFEPNSPHQQGISAEWAYGTLSNDLELYDAVLELGDKLTSTRRVKPPKGITDPSLDQMTPATIAQEAPPVS